VRLELEIDSNFQISRAYQPKIGASSLVTGDSKLEFKKDISGALENLDGQAPVGDTAIERNNAWDAPEQKLLNSSYGDGDYILAHHANDDSLNSISSIENEIKETLEAVKRAGTAMENAGTSVKSLTASVHELVSENDKGVSDLIRNSNSAIEELRLAMTDIRNIISDPIIRKQVSDTLESLPKVLDEAELALSSTKLTMQQFEKVGAAAEEAVANAGNSIQSLDRTINNIERFTEPLSANAEALVEQTLDTFANLDRAISQVNQFGEHINNKNGSLRHLLEDEELYFQIKRTIDNIEMASVRIRPILDDVRVFSDKLARDPSQLGVKGALTSRPTGLGLK
jgi:phospholipid/cholesterol/gamma-HCH transport system substrate-binding protein